MKRSTIFILITVLIGSGTLFSNSSNMRKPIPASNIIEINGEIQAIMTIIPSGETGHQGPQSAFVQVKLKNSKTGKVHTIRIAPGYFLRMKGFMLHKNDEMRIKAIREIGSLEMKSMEIEVKGKVLILRDNYGMGFWKKNEEGQKRSDILKK